MIAYVFQKYPEKFAFQLPIILQQFTHKIYYFLISLSIYSHFIVNLQSFLVKLKLIIFT